MTIELFYLFPDVSKILCLEDPQLLKGVSQFLTTIFVMKSSFGTCQKQVINFTRKMVGLAGI
ncbi:hypothetical protein [Nostoc sp. FACHB-888]|uniref:hypothetical protein n=1 Tax=Nostoc sp. FACHB-888 TaxID=2692842 RepID=UPI001685EF16|nr:hypothetical protein [Nostoc sp. FACHB-888]MBD2244966.1 hypothetical protein [Nostoc sp. FACHB-888]